MADKPDIVRALEPLVDAFEILGVTYRVGGSVATSAYGFPRATLDVDIVCDLTVDSVSRLVEALRDTYYIDADMIIEAIQLRRSFNIIHLATMVKVDVFLVKARPFDRSAFLRVVEDTLEDSPDARTFLLSSPEDMVIHKLDWFRRGNEVSERQWLDVVGVLKVQHDELDRAYLAQWAHALDLTSLLERAYEEAGMV